MGTNNGSLLHIELKKICKNNGSLLPRHIPVKMKVKFTQIMGLFWAQYGHRIHKNQWWLIIVCNLHILNNGSLWLGHYVNNTYSGPLIIPESF